MSFDYSNPKAMDATFPGPEQKPRGWWSRNWKWFVPTVFLIMILICCGGPVAIFFGAIGVLRNAEPYVSTMQKIQSNPEAQEAFGQPIRDVSWIPVGQVSMENDTGSAELRWDLAGPKGKGKAYVKARMMNGKWEVVVIEVTLPNGKKLTIHDEGPGGAPPFNPQGSAPPDKSKEEAAPQPDLNPNIPMTEETEPKK
jgi:hypothetical protein